MFPSEDAVDREEARRLAEGVLELSQTQTGEASEAEAEAGTMAEEKADERRTMAEVALKKETVLSRYEEETEGELEEALELEDAFEELELERIERLERQRSLDEARIRSLLDRGDDKGPAPVSSSLGAGVGDGHASQGGALSRTPLSFQANPVEPRLESSGGPVTFERILDQRSAPPRIEGSRRAAYQAIERARELAHNRQVAGNKLSVTIRIDDTSQIKITITPIGDGRHELAFVVGDPRLRQELQRSLPEIRTAASELPIDIADVWIGETSEPILAPPDEAIDPDHGEKHEQR